MEFVHLHNQTHYSMLDSSITSSELIKAAAADNQKALAITDYGVMFGAIEFFTECKKNKIKPIIGMTAFMAEGSRFDKSRNKDSRNYYHIVLLAKNQEGYKNLIKLSSLGFTEGFYYKPRIDKELLEEYQEGLICLSASKNGIISYHLINDGYDRAYEEAEYYKELFDDDFYIEIQNHFLKEERIVLEQAPRLASELNIKLVAANDIHYLKQEHATAHNVLLLIKEATAANSGELDHKNIRMGSSEFYFKTQEQMLNLFRDYPDAIESTLEIAGKCNLEIDLDTLHMPEFPIPESSAATTDNEYLRELTYKGLEKKYKDVTDAIRKRADYELEVIKDMGFPGYFLIVWDFIRAARELNVSVGPGRGSAAGSVVAYALDITNVDPLPYDLLFERFLNPERQSMPDIDIDFNDAKRDTIIDYVKKQYGENAVAQIITFGKLSSKAVLTDVGRVLGVDLALIRQYTKQIPVEQGKVKELKEALELFEFKDLKNTDDPLLKEWIEYSLILEGKFRHTGIHAAGVVIAPGEITNYLPVYKSTKTKDQSIDIATQYSMNNLEQAGLLKMDFLGLRTLSIIDSTLELIERNHEIKIDIDAIDFQDKKTFQLLSDGNTQAVFQFESGGMQEYLKQLKPESLEEITAMNALYRPGPMANIPDFIDRKFGRKPIEYLHPLMEKTLKTTYGIIVYQEQVMLLVQEIADFTLGEADILRRAMGKKKKDVMASMKPKFIEGAKKHGISKKLAEQIFDLIESFASYGFNKSHSLAYSYLAYQTAWLKAHYPGEFLAANMTAESNDQDKIVLLKEEAKKFGVKLLPPDVNKSIGNFNYTDGKIFFGLSAIRNFGSLAADSVVKAREEKPFTSFFDFVARVDTRLVNKRALEALIFAGAFDSLITKNRKALYMSVENAIEYAKAYNEHSNINMNSLFGGSKNASPLVEPKLPQVEDWSEAERLNREKDVLNFYVSGHPLLSNEVVVKSFAKTDLNTAKRFKNNEVTTVAGIVKSIRIRRDKEDKSIAFIILEDFDAEAEVIFWSDAFDKYSTYLKQDQIIICNGKIQMRNDSLKIVAESVQSPEEAITKLAKGITVWVNLEDADDDLQSFLDKYKSENKSSVRLNFNVYNSSEDYKAVYNVENHKFVLDYKSMKELERVFGSRNVRLIV
jgi:DNA polymerase-3 subunit alpha